MHKLDTNKENTWCPGCGNFGIMNAFKKALAALTNKGIDPKSIVITSGIGCHGKIFDYLNVSGIYSLHGRALATAQGIKLANPELNVICFGGDGDSLGEGLEHTMFAAKRNMDITLLLHNNGTYGLTTGQASPMSLQGYRGISTPQGNIERPFTPITLMYEAGATYISRSYSTKIDHLTEVITGAVLHKGFSFVEILQPCISYNNTYDLYNQKVRIMDGVPSNETVAYSLARNKDDIHIGIFKDESIPIYHEQLLGSHIPANERITRNHRCEIIKSMYP
ncbi:MAG: 2-oxoglutarate synthase [Candidatus Cloacimonetes bacterium HGW-Cloacimonetes-1]|jgi:2-oxoglutarate ferredoxin oxidoreductase subunit beta|nr:MAG: 2-oxoglutarate synthase [Candidatus Cloacimonetes bacterium HGW-Cloacimonetes-1]